MADEEIDRGPPKQKKRELEENVPSLRHLPRKSEESTFADPDPSASATETSDANPGKPGEALGGGGFGHSGAFSQILSGAMVTPPVGSPRTTPQILTAIPLDTVNVPVVTVPVFLALESPAVTGQFARTHQSVLASVTAQAQLKLHKASAELSACSSAHSMLTPLPLGLLPSSEKDDHHMSEAEQAPDANQNAQPARVFVKEASSDSYNWRKYGQKQVKSSDRLRSYYKCTNPNCSAKKKVEHWQDGRVTEVIYRGVHSHEPPQKYRFHKEKTSHSVGPVGEHRGMNVHSKENLELVPFVTKLEQTSGNETSEQKLHCSSDCEEDAGSKFKENHDDQPDAKRRHNESIPTYSSPVFKTIKESKIVVQRACDVGLANDGYRWRKYGQKIVKGNPNPRSYYRCTHNGCPVRKHVERALEDAKAMVITYEGKHNHDLPTPKSASQLPALRIASDALLVATNEHRPYDFSPDQKHDTKSPSANIADGAVEIGKTAVESAQTLLSIGMESSSPAEAVGENSALPRIFRENPAAVPVQNS